MSGHFKQIEDTEGIIAGLEYERRGKPPHEWHGDTSWQLLMRDAVAILHDSEEASIRVVLDTYSILAMGSQDRAVALVYPSGHDVIKSINRIARTLLRRKRGQQSTRIDWDKQPLGKEPDKLLALMLGCSVSAVYKARTDRDIPAYRSKPQQWVND